MRVDLMTAQVNSLIAQVAVMDEKDKNFANKVESLVLDMSCLTKDLHAIRNILTEAKGGWRAIIIMGTGAGVVVGWLLSRADLLSRLFGH